MVIGRRVLDLGCGCGLLGLAALSVGAREVVLLDAAPEVAALARRNAQRNAVDGRQALVVSRSWREDLSDLGTFDVVFACDVLYPIARQTTEDTPNAAESAGS